MSVLTDDLCFESNAQPSLVYPSLPKQQQQQEKEEQEQSDRQTCIHFASRLIKLRSELRSPSYMRSSYYQPTTTLSQVGRVNSLPNVYQFNQQENNDHPYSNYLDCREDESEIISTTGDESSQLTQFVHRRRSTTVKNTNNVLALPPKQDFIINKPETKRSISLRDIIYESMQNKDAPIKSDHFPSLALKSQLLFKEKIEEKRETLVISNKEENCCTCNKKISSIKPTPSLSRETNKSLLTAISSDSEEDDSVLFNKKAVMKRRPTTTAFLVSLSPSSAAAASAAKWRRSNKRQVRSLQTDSL